MNDMCHPISGTKTTRRVARRFWRMRCQRDPLHRPRASRPLASRVEEEAVRDDVRVVIRTSVLRSSVLHQVQSLCLGRGEDGWQLLCRCTRMPAQASPTPAPSRVSSPSPPQGMQAKLTSHNALVLRRETPPPPKPPRPQTQTPPPPKPRSQTPPRPLPPRRERSRGAAARPASSW